MKSQFPAFKYAALLSVLALAFPLSSFARDKNERSVMIYDHVQVAGAQLQPGEYRVQWEGNGSAVQVNFIKNGKNVATVPATIKMDDQRVTRDDVVTKTIGNAETLQELDFGHGKDALIFSQNGM